MRHIAQITMELEDFYNKSTSKDERLRAKLGIFHLDEFGRLNPQTVELIYEHPNILLEIDDEFEMIHAGMVYSIYQYGKNLASFSDFNLALEYTLFKKKLL